MNFSSSRTQSMFSNLKIIYFLANISENNSTKSLMLFGLFALKFKTISVHTVVDN